LSPRVACFEVSIYLLSGQNDGQRQDVDVWLLAEVRKTFAAATGCGPRIWAFPSANPSVSSPPQNKNGSDGLAKQKQFCDNVIVSLVQSAKVNEKQIKTGSK
jgi:hypothetical protein